MSNLSVLYSISVLLITIRSYDVILLLIMM